MIAANVELSNQEDLVRLLHTSDEEAVKPSYIFMLDSNFAIS